MLLGERGGGAFGPPLGNVTGVLLGGGEREGAFGPPLGNVTGVLLGERGHLGSP